MGKRQKYKIANRSVEIHTEFPESLSGFLPGFVHFHDSADDNEPLIHLSEEFESEETKLISADIENEVIHTFSLEEETCRLSKNGNRYLFTIEEKGGAGSTEFAMEIGSPNVRFRLAPNPVHLKFSLWMAFAFAGIPRKISALHSSVIIYNNSAVLFLGESGTGKSTHTRLWLNHIKGSKLLNDDSPILSIEDGEPVVHGSPWSGKGQVYINESYPVKAIVRIRQHPFNKLQKLNILESFGALYPSFPPAFLKDNYFEGHICEIISKVISTTPVFLLHCLPDREAAEMVKESIYI